ncbi:MAG: hypothetical protein GY938_14080 [Ketobacter sp.]|nr:hypothetical protein [Ketobacter sp.]
MLIGSSASASNISGFYRTVGSIGVSYSSIDIAGWGDDLMETMAGQGTLNFGQYQAMFSKQDAAAGVALGIHDLMSAGGVYIASCVLGIGEAPTIGAPAFSCDMNENSYSVILGGDSAVAIQGDVTSTDTMEVYHWGQMLGVGTSVSATTSNGSLDNGASSSGGSIAVLHVTQSDGAMGSNDWEIKIEDSTDDAAWSDLTTFTADGSQTIAEVGTSSGTVNRYTRATVTKTAGTDLIFWINLVRL